MITDLVKAAGSSSDKALEQIDKASALLCQANTLLEVNHILGMAEAAQAYALRQKSSDEIIGYAHAIKIHALAKLGSLLIATPKHSGAKGIGKSAVPDRNHTPPPTLAELGIDKKTSSVAQSLAKLDEDDLQSVVARQKTVSQAIKCKAEKKRSTDLARPVEIDLPAGIHRGDFRDLSDQISDNSVDLIFTDPPYDADSVVLYEDAARIAARILKPGASMIAYSGQRHLPDVMAGMSKHLRYWWTIAGVHEGGNQMLQKLGIRCGWKPLLWFVKDTRGDIQNVMLDVVRGDREKTAHEWQQSEIEAAHIIDKLCTAQGVVVDFCLGGGTTAVACKKLNRKFIGFEINAASIERSVERLAA